MLKRSVDLSSCDGEPIHLIGGVQPNGALVAADERTGRVLFASDNQEAYFGRSAAALLGSPLAALFGETEARALSMAGRPPAPPELLRPAFPDIPRPDGPPVAVECYPHRFAGRLILEFVPRESGPASAWEDDLVRRRIVSDLVRPGSLQDLAAVGAGIVREVTGFDRVMIYRFAPDRHGEVIAESTVRPDSFLGLHYPASDIPDPARRHFALNVIRSIPDVHAVPVPILGLSGGLSGGRAEAASDDPLDLTFSKLRAVAPVHVEYLANMGVGASLSISLIANGELWGLVACHHYGPLHLSLSRLRFCELLGGTLSALLQSHENTVQLRHSIRAEKLAFAIEREARPGRPLSSVILGRSEEILAECEAQGMILKLGAERFELGKVPRREWSPAGLSKALVEGIAATDRLEDAREGEEPPRGGVAGAAMMELSDDGEDWLVLFREEFEHAIRWAGNPDKRGTTLRDGTLRLSPRGSFALWREERRGRSRPFTAIDGEILRIIRRALFAMNSLDRERAAVAARAEAEAAETRLRLALLDAARNRSLGELASALAHELSQPLSAVSNYVNACRQELKNYGLAMTPHISGLMENAVAEASRAADLVRRLRNLIGAGEVAFEHADLHAVIRQGVDLALAASPEMRPTVRFRFDGGLGPFLLDPVQIAQVILNLVRNSLTAMRGSDEPVLTIATRAVGDAVEVSVHDTGRGIDSSIRRTLFEPFHNSTTSGMGIGLSLCRSIVEAHGGRISTRPAPSGTEFVFTLKHGEGCDD